MEQDFNPGLVLISLSGTGPKLAFLQTQSVPAICDFELQGGTCDFVT